MSQMATRLMMLQKPRIRFKLNDSFVDEFAGKQPDWGPLGYVIYKRSYSRDIDKTPERCEELARRHGLTNTEEFWLTCTRVVEGIYNIQKGHCEALKLPWNNVKAQLSAQEMFRRMWDFKWTPPGRGLYMMGTDILWELGSAPVLNCCMVSTADLKSNFAEPFCFLMDMSLLGVGVGFDTKGKESVLIRPPKFGTQVHAVEDSREGWVESVRHLLDAFVGKKMMPLAFDYTPIRDKGAPIKRFGGTCPGPMPLYECHKALVELFYNGYLQLIPEHNERHYGQEIATLRFGKAEEFEPYHITSTQIVDTYNIIGKCVVAGGRRRSAELAIGDYYDEEFISLKQDVEKLEEYRYISNNSVSAEIGMNYEEIAGLTASNGEPGFLYLENARKFGRMIDPPTWKDKRVDGYNPCFHKDAPIITSHGVRKVEDIQQGDIVWTGKRWSAIAAKHDSGIQPCFEYRTAAGSFLGTSNHRIFEAGIKVEVGEASLVDTTMGPPKLAWLDLKDDIVDGIVLGLGKTSRGLVLLSGTHKRINELYHPILRDYFDDSIKSPLLNTHVVKTTITADELPPHSDRYVPNRFIYGSFGKVVGILKGLFASKGRLSKMNGSASLLLYSKTMAKQTQVLLSAIGIRSFMTEKNFHNKAVYRVVVSADINRFNDIVGLSPSLQQQLDTIIKTREELNSLDSSTASMSYKINEVIPLGDCQVYDLTVEDEEHALWCGGLKVANCGEITLESHETCVSGDTEIQTKTGLKNIASLVGKDVEVWNGQQWSQVRPFKTADNAKMVRVCFSDGSHLDCTEYHRFSVRAKTRRHFIAKKAHELKPKDILPTFELGDRETDITETLAYEYGLFAGDGYLDRTKKMICMKQEDIEKANPHGTRYKPHQPDRYNYPMQRVSLPLHYGICELIKNRRFGLPEAIALWNSKSILEFFAGWIDSDGHISNQGRDGFESYRIYGTKKNLESAQLILRRADINYTCLSLFAEAGEKTNMGIRNYDLWYLTIHSHECSKIPTRVRVAQYFATGHAANNRHPGSSISNKRNQTVVSVTPIKSQPSYCFYEPKEGMGVFNNVLTYQCNVPETYPCMHEDLDDYLKTLKYAYLYGKTVSLLPSHNERTNMVQMRNRRIGLSQAGIVQNINRIGFREHMRWCDEAYKYICKLDAKYSEEWLCVPKSLKKTSCKPGGTTPLLPGIQGGMRHPESEYYIKNVRIPEWSPIVKACQDAGYKVEKAIAEPNTMVISFPVKEKNFAKSTQDVTIWEQMELLAQLQAYWADNSVSCTITVQEHEKKDIPKVLEMYETRIKGVSFLPLEDHGYKQPPFIPITEEEYMELKKDLKPLDLSESQHEVTEKFCDSESCMLGEVG